MYLEEYLIKDLALIRVKEGFEISEGKTHIKSGALIEVANGLAFVDYYNTTHTNSEWDSIAFKINEIKLSHCEVIVSFGGAIFRSIPNAHEFLSSYKKDYDIKDNIYVS